MSRAGTRTSTCPTASTPRRSSARMASRSTSSACSTATSGGAAGDISAAVEEATTPQSGELLWEPSPESIERSQMTAFMRWLAASGHNVELEDYEALWRWSVDELEDFWAAIWDYFDGISSQPRPDVLAERVMPGAQWFAGAELSCAEHVCRGKPGGEVAVLHASELRDLDEMTWDELRDAVARVAAGLRSLG